MTRRTWDTLDGWEVAAGWDPPLQYFFLDISRECEHDDDEDREGVECEICHGSGTQYLYNNLDDKSNRVDTMGGIHNLDIVEELIREYLTDYPPEVMSTLYEDRSLQRGNENLYYGAIGRIRKESDAE
jgi:hypothetical protein